MTRRTWLLLTTAFLAALAIFGMANAASASLPAGPSSSPAQGVNTQSKDDPFGIATFNCADIQTYHIDKQLNARASAIIAKCSDAPQKSEAKPASPKGNTGVGAINQLARPFVYGLADVNTHPSNSAAIQSETFSWQNGATIVVFYNDLSGGSTGKGSYSTDSGATFARIPGDPFATGHGSNFGDPAVVYDVLHAKWIGTWLTSGCGGQGVGAWTSPDGIIWTVAGCAANAGGGNGDRNSAWQDNTPTSPFYGRSYVSYNDFGLGGGALRTAFSNDGGATWAAPVTVFGSFVRDIQLTGLPNGNVILAAMNEGGGGVANRQNLFYLSSNGGVTWTQITQGAPYPPPGIVNCAGNSYFRVITPQIRHMGWGQPAGGPGNVVHYAYTQRGAGADEGDIYYVRSADGGSTWSTPLLLNTDSSLRAQWMPSVGVTPGGAVFVKWYDRRDTTTNDYWVYGRASLDNGVTWQADMAVSDAVIPQPIVQTANCYMGDYDYWQGDGTTVQGSWTDSRGAGSGGTQDVFHDRIPLIQGTPTPTTTGTPPTTTATRTVTLTPTATATVCGGTSAYSIVSSTGATIVPAANFVTGSNCDDCVNSVALPFPFRLYDQTFNSVGVSSNGNAQFNSADAAYTNTCMPYTAANYAILPHWDDLLLTGTNQGIYTGVSGTAPNRIFDIEWRGGYFSGGGTVDIELRLYENSPTGQFDVIYGVVTQGGLGATVGVQRDTGSLFTQFECNTASTLSPGLKLTFTQPPCSTGTPATATNTPVPPTATRTNTAGAVTASPTCGGPSGTPGPFVQSGVITPDLYGAAIDNNGTFAYAAGGYSFSASNTVNQFSRFDPTTGVWTALTPVPAGGDAAEALGVYAPNVNRFYMFGGVQGPSLTTVLGTARYYDLTTNTWGTGLAMPGLRQQMAGGYFNGKIYLVGGYDTPNVTPQAQVWEYDPVANTYTTTRLNIPQALGGPGSGIINGHIYVAGGRDAGNTNRNILYDYNIAANTWATLANLPTGVNVPASAVIGGKLMISGGGNPFLGPNGRPTLPKGEAPLITNISQIYDPVANSWSAGPTLLSNLSFATGTGFGNKVIVVGGYTGSSTTNQTEVSTAASAPCATNTATVVIASPTPCSGGGGPIIVNGAITTSDPTQTGRLFRSGVASACGAPNPCSTIGGTYHYDLLGPYVNTSGSTVCITVQLDTACTGTNFIFSGGYVGPFNPALICTNNVGDAGGSPNGAPVTYGFNVPAGGTFYVNVAEVTANAGCAAYMVTITGLPGGGGCTPTPTVVAGTPTRTITPGGNPSPTACAGGTPGPWTAATPVPIAIVRYAFAQNANIFYVMGGVTTGGMITNAANKYDASTGLWSPMAAISGSPGEAPSAAYFNGKIYLGGGGGFTGFFIYDVPSNTWTTGPAMPLGTYGAAAGAFNGKVFFAGGTSTSGPTTNLQIFDIAGNSWSVGTAMPGTGYFLGGNTSSGQYLYLTGSYGAAPAGPQNSSSIHTRLSTKNNVKPSAPDANGTSTLRLDMSSAPGAWTTGPVWTQARADMGLAYDPSSQKLYALGGDAQNGGYFDSTNLVDELSVAAWPAGAWVASLPNLPLPNRQANQAGFTSNDLRIWSTGGINGATFAFQGEHLYRSNGGCQGTPTNTPIPGTATRTATVGATVTPGATATCVPSAGGWTAGASLPTGLVRAWGVNFPTNGKFYAMGGRTGDGDPNLAQRNPLEYNPATNTWVAKAAQFSDLLTSNMQGGALTMGGVPVIVMVGGSAGGGTVGTTEVKMYNPVTDVMTTIASDPWPPGGTTLPGGTVVLNNKLYVLGGFVISTSMSSQIWEFDPAAAAGSRWTLKSTALPVQLGYIPAATIGNAIYTGGGSTWDGTTLQDSANAYKYDPVANTIVTLPNTPRATGETRGVAFNGKLWVLGGGRSAPNPGNQVEVFDPVANTWSSGPSFVLARRNFPADTNGTKIFLAGGYAPTAPDLSMEIFSAPVVCGGTTVTPTTAPSTATRTNTPPVPSTSTSTPPVPSTSTSTATSTTIPTSTRTAAPPSATPTICIMKFEDVSPSDWFYGYVEYLYCHGVISGYNTVPPCIQAGRTCFKPGNNTTRGQMAKIVVRAFNFPINTTGGPHFIDVAPGSTFYTYIETGKNMGLFSGYADGTYRPNNNVTRGQISKIIVNAAIIADPGNWTLINPATNSFEDVPVGSTFFRHIETAAAHNILSGYPCGVPPAGPCQPGNKPYFLPGVSATRAQISKITYLAVTYPPTR